MRGFLLSSSYACPSSSRSLKFALRSAPSIIFSYSQCRLQMYTAPAPQCVCPERCSTAVSTPQQAEICTCPNLWCAGTLSPIPQTTLRSLLPNSQSCNGQLWLTAPCFTYQRNSGACNSSVCIGCASTNVFALPLSLPLCSRQSFMCYVAASSRICFGKYSGGNSLNLSRFRKAKPVSNFQAFCKVRRGLHQV